ncbi:MAG: putative DNA binding domain-containing protein [Gammaproteobacteria bacterium]|nr:putative DNA binding domain-containing protein [Aestuariivita sp.]MCY4268705.1 putative DNA binding domain-containing protein [Gammaproteobacteria bacterium]MCY4297275.1 putative DNA binding domain-containing protein [Gammaproteobacteria bacterium]
MRTAANIETLLAELDQCVADDLEDQQLEFKQWNLRSRNSAEKIVVEMAVCMANGGGGTVVFGVADRIRGRDKAILGVPPEIDSNLLKKKVYDQTDPKITPVFEELSVAEGTGRLLLMQIHPGMPPYTDTAGKGTIRIGKDCLPLTGTLRRKIGVETGETDYTAESAVKTDAALLSATALEALRDQARKERAPNDLLKLSDADLLATLGLVKRGKLTRAAILLAGTEAAIREFVPGHNWTFLQMASDTDYGIREDRVSALPLSVQRVEELLIPFNPITTHQQGLFHFEYRTWPEIAVREALMNAFCHADLCIAGPIMVKLYPDRLEISNNGGFIAGISPDNILHHQPAARNPLLVEALTRLRLVNRSNLGISRMYSALLIEGKEPPQFREIGESVLVCFFKRDLNAAFRLFAAEESEGGRSLGIDELLLLRYLLQHPEVETGMAATLCQRSVPEIRERLSAMESAGYIDHGGQGRGAYWCIRPDLYNRLTESIHGESRRRIDWEAAKTRVLSILMDRARRSEPGLGNKEIRRITRFDRNQARRLMRELMRENANIRVVGERRWTRYEQVNAREH